MLLFWVAAMLLTGCSSSQVDSLPEVVATESPMAAVSEACSTAAQAAVAAEEELYETHPLYSAEYPGPNASEEALSNYDALMADEEAQWVELMKPVYEFCQSPEEWFAVAQQFPAVAGVTGAEFVDTFTLESWCDSYPQAKACTGLDEWLVGHKS